MTQNKVTTILSYQGKLTFETIDEILVEFKKKIHPFDLKVVVQKRIYSILVECLENTYRHRISVNNSPKHAPVELSLIDAGDLFEIRVGNYIHNDRVDFLVDKIKSINKLDQNGLNMLYRESISKARISDKGGAGLGIIEIARNSRQKLKYEIEPKDNNHSFFSFIILINKSL